MRVIMYPGRASHDGNPYIDLLVGSLKKRGIEIFEWNRYFSVACGDIFHIHWPEHIAIIRRRRFQTQHADLISRNFFRTLTRIKQSGGKIAWTVHNIAPHENHMSDDPFLADFMRNFLRSVDLCISLTHSGIVKIMDAFPVLEKTKFHVVRHPHYRSVLRKKRTTPQLRAKFGIRPEQKVFSMLGALRASKQPDIVAKEFAQLDDEKYHLILGGSAPASLKRHLYQLLGSRRNHTLECRRLTDEEILERYAITDVSIVPGTEYLNSGATYTALSVDVPILASASPVNHELQSLVGREWMRLFTGAFVGRLFSEVASDLANRSSSAQCELSEFDPDKCAQECIKAYESVL